MLHKFIAQSSPSKKQRNIPAQVWAKRNVLKKLTMHSKFNKKSKKQYDQILSQLKKQKNSLSINLLNSKIKLSPNPVGPQLISNNIKTMRKLSLVKDQNTVRYTNNFFASNLFSLHGLKSYQHKSIISQGNRFLDVKKISMTHKKLQIEKISPDKIKPKSERKMSLNISSDDKLSIREHRRSFSGLRQENPSKNYDNQKSKDFLKISNKELHLAKQLHQNIQCYIQQNSKQRPQIFFNRSRTELDFSKNSQLIKINKTQSKKDNLRPKSCIPRKKSNIIGQIKYQDNQFKNQGWKTQAVANQDQDFTPFFHY